MQTNLNVIRLLIAIAAIITIASVFASDGQLEINQACAVNTGCFPADAPGFPVTITTPGSYRLTGNLDLSAVDSSLDGINVSAPAVTVDLGGFHIAGSTTCSGSGASISCSPSGTGSGVKFTNSATASVVQNGIVRNMTNSGIFCLATGARVQNITATHNANDGILAQQGTLVVNSVAIENGDDGINVTSGSMIDGVTSIGNGQNGIHAEGFSGGSVVTRTIAQNNGSRGFHLFGFAKFGKNNLSIGNQNGDRCGAGICTERKRIYITKDSHQGNSVLAACVPGFHTASISQLQYLGEYAYDNTLGPAAPYNDPGPKLNEGWALSGGNGPGITCNSWNSALSTDTGLTVWFTWDVNTNTVNYLPSNLPQVRYRQCDLNLPVWCAEY